MQHARQSLPLLILPLLAFGPPAPAQDTFGGSQPRAAPAPAQPAVQRPAAPQTPTAPVARPAPGFEARDGAPEAGPTVSPADELQDFGVAPTSRLHFGAMHGPTPASIPGGRVVTTAELAPMLRSSTGQYLLLDVLGGLETLPNALAAVWLAQAGSFDDEVQLQAASAFQKATGGRKDMPIVLFCQSSHCWMSYNAALRAIAAGYTNVLWYRGGVEAWKAAGLTVQDAGLAPGARNPAN